jgi:hypothetical protein
MTDSLQKKWRDLCVAAVKEPDSEKLASLVTQILQTFEEGDDQALTLRKTGAPVSGQL